MKAKPKTEMLLDQNQKPAKAKAKKKKRSSSHSKKHKHKKHRGKTPLLFFLNKRSFRTVIG